MHHIGNMSNPLMNGKCVLLINPWKHFKIFVYFHGVFNMKRQYVEDFYSHNKYLLYRMYNWPVVYENHFSYASLYSK